MPVVAQPAFVIMLLPLELETKLYVKRDDSQERLIGPSGDKDILFVPI